MDTPLYNHITKEDFEYVYEPAEDTFFLLDAIEKDLPFIEKLQPNICLEIGSGSGLIISALSKKFNKFCYCISSDINDRACSVTKSTSIHNKTIVDPVSMNFGDGIRSGLIDLLLFNPPYVITSNEEIPNLSKNEKNFTDGITTKKLVTSWAGGLDGRFIIDKLITKLYTILSPNGVFYLLVLKENKPMDILKLLNTNGFDGEILMERRIPGEHLFVLKIIHKHKK